MSSLSRLVLSLCLCLLALYATQVTAGGTACCNTECCCSVCDFKICSNTPPPVSGSCRCENTAGYTCTISGNNFPPAYPPYPSLPPPGPQYPQQPVYPSPFYPRPPSYVGPGPNYPVPNYIQPSYPAPNYPAPNYPAPNYPTPNYSIPFYPVGTGATYGNGGNNGNSIGSGVIPINPFNPGPVISGSPCICGRPPSSYCTASLPCTQVSLPLTTLIPPSSENAWFFGQNTEFIQTPLGIVLVVVAAILVLLIVCLIIAFIVSLCQK